MSDINFQIDVNPSLNIFLEGTTGSFKIGKKNTECSSLEVKYFSTHIGLNFSNSQNSQILSELAPVREIFDAKKLDFDQIMQRNIDDARVSSELIPYILDTNNDISVKFFPPIVILALPIENDGINPLPFYPKVSSYESNTKQLGIEKWYITRSGEIGEEVFQFSQPILGNKIEKKKLVRFDIDNKKCKLVIIDGQHRAMALLALYRNLKDEWGNEKRSPYKSFYKEWTPDFIKKFDLDEVELPAIICTVPTLDTEYQGDYNLEKAARSIFLTLNKTARPVSSARNMLLNDNDLISYFMRSVLSNIKDSDNRSNDRLRINNIDLDEEKQKLSNPIAITSVKSLYYIIEHLLLSKNDSLNGISDRKGNFTSRTDFDHALEKLNGFDLLSSDQHADLKRNRFTSDASKLLNESFISLFGAYILKAFRKFEPFEVYSKSTILLQERISESNDVQINSMIFNGQGEINIFLEHRKNLKDRLDNSIFDDLPRMEDVLEELDNTKKRLDKRLDELASLRVEKFIALNKEKNKFFIDKKIPEKIHKQINYIYLNIFMSQAFQAALVCEFFHEIESLQAADTFSLNKSQYNVNEMFNNYLSQMNKFFCPKSFSSFKKLIILFIGYVEGKDASDLSEPLGDSLFRKIVSFGEMKPASWPRYRYIILEIWNPSDSLLNKKVVKERQECRDAVFSQLLKKNKNQYSQDKRIHIEDFSEEENKKISDNTFSTYKDFLRIFDRASEIKESMF